MTRPASSGPMPSRLSASAIFNLKPGDAAVDGACVEALGGAGGQQASDVLLDDTEDRPGAKFATMDLIGLPWQVIVGPKGLAEGKVEVKSRAGGERSSVSIEDAVAMVTGA